MPKLGANMSIDDEILTCEAELRDAQLTGDVAVLERLLDDDLLFGAIDGTLATKWDDLALHASRRLQITRMEPVERRMIHLGATSVVSVLMDAAATMDGTAIAATLRYTRVWHKRPEGWRVVAGHMSRVGA